MECDVTWKHLFYQSPSFHKLWKIETNFKDGLHLPRFIFSNIPSEDISGSYQKNETYLSFDIEPFCTNAPSQLVLTC